NRYSTTAQKILGELFIKQNELQKAEKLYTRALEVRPLDWARLGLAKVKQLKGDLDTAGSWLDRIVSDNPLFLPAYDVLADNWDMKGVHLESLNTLQKAVEVSPMSILRQKRLAIVAEKNGNSALAIEALRKTVRLGRLSCYGELDDQFNFARAVSNAIQNKVDLPNGIAAEALTILHTAQKEMDLTDEEVAQCHMLTGRIHASSGNHSEANASMGEAERYLDEEDVGIDAELDRLELLLSMGQKIQAEDLLKNLQEKYQGDQSALEKIDRFLNEPASAANKELVAKVNREGIDLYSDGEFDTALSCFERARILFPNHVGIQLNIVQSLIGKMRIEPENEFLQNECQSSLDLVHSLVDSDHPQYSRFIRLKRKAKLASSEQI
ncbi:MAG: tetratricopeptide (TPR) repeat protein, partial [Lentisphaeria bacterium]